MYLYRRPRSRRPVLARRRGRRSDLVDFKLLRAPRALVMMRIWHCLVPARNVLQISRAPGAVLHLWLRSRPGYFLEPRRSCSRGLLLLILCRDARCSRGVGQFRSRASLVAENELLRQQLAAAKSRLQRKRVSRSTPVSTTRLATPGPPAGTACASNARG